MLAAFPEGTSWDSVVTGTRPAGATSGWRVGSAGVVSPIRCILGGSFATQAAVATIEGITRHSFLSCHQTDHFPEIQQIPVGLQ